MTIEHKELISISKDGVPVCMYETDEQGNKNALYLEFPRYGLNMPFFTCHYSDGVRNGSYRLFEAPSQEHLSWKTEEEGTYVDGKKMPWKIYEIDGDGNLMSTNNYYPGRPVGMNSEYQEDKLADYHILIKEFGENRREAKDYYVCSVKQDDVYLNREHPEFYFDIEDKSYSQTIEYMTYIASQKEGEFRV